MQPSAPGPSGREMLRHLRAIRRDPLGFLEHCAGVYGDIVRFPVGRRPVFAVNAPEAIQRVLQDNHPNYSKDTIQFNTLALVTGRGLLTSDGDNWLRQRRLLQPVFHRERVVDDGVEMTAATERMLARWDKLPNGARIDVDEEMLKLALEIVGRTLFGADLAATAADLVQAVLAALDYVVYRAQTPLAPPLALPTPRHRRVRAALAQLDQAVARLVEARRAGPERDDLLQRLLGARGDDGAPLTKQQVRDELVTVLVAGHETVASALAWAWHLLAQQPGAQARLEAELAARLGPRRPDPDDLAGLPYTRAVFDEALRLYPPAWLITRRALGPDLLGGWPVPAGALLILSPYVVQRRADLWPDPTSFQPERFLPAASQARPRFAYFPFGGGPRLCIGAGFALLEGPLVLATVAQRYRLLPAPDHRVRPEALVTIRPRGGLPMRLQRRGAGER